MDDSHICTNCGAELANKPHIKIVFENWEPEGLSTCLCLQCLSTYLHVYVAGVGDDKIRVKLPDYLEVKFIRGRA